VLHECVCFISHTTVALTGELQREGSQTQEERLSHGSKKLVAERDWCLIKVSPRENMLGSSLERKGVDWKLIVLFLWIDVILSDVYHWQRPKIEEKCQQSDLSTEGSVRELRERLTTYIRPFFKGEMDTRSLSFEEGSNEERVPTLNP
jgi:hypothetical protein